MKVYESNFDYNYAFPTVTLAYFLRYPNPYSKHVLSTDVIDRYIDPKTNRLHSLRLHLKKSKVPSGILRFLPTGLAGPGGASQSYILEKSVIDVEEGWMETESKNLEWTGILSVIEKQKYRSLAPSQPQSAPSSSQDQSKTDWTHCTTTVTFTSKLGQSKSLSRRTTDAPSADEETSKQGFFAAWSTAGVQRTVELLGVKRTKSALVNGKAGMNIVLERLRSGGIVGVLEGMRKDRMEMMGGDGGVWKKAWINGQGGRDTDDYD